MAKDKKILDRMLDRFRLSADAEADNRKRGLEALKFRAGGRYQWDTTIYNNRIGENRPAESHNQIPQFVYKITNNMRMNMPQVKIIPQEDSDRETADILEGMCREIQSSSEAEVALDTAADYQVTCGWGYARVLTEYEDDEDESEDQIIKIKRVPNPFMVYDDPFTLEQDRSDRRFAFVVTDRPIDEFNRDNDKNYSATDLKSIGDSQPEWASAADNMIREVEYFEIIDENIGDAGTKKRIRKKVIWRRCTAIEILETRTWPGKYIPLIFISGQELNIDGKRQYTGLVEGLMAPQKQYNYWTNAATEAVALAPKSPFIMALGQVEGLEKIWDDANTKSFPYLPYKPTTVDGVAVPPPQRQSPSADISSFIALVQGAQNNMYSVSGIYPAALGQQSNETSGRAINARKVEGEVSNFHFPDNMARSIRFLGRVLIDLIPKIYDTKRIITILHMDGKTESVTVNAPFEDKKGKKREFDLSKGKYHVAVTTGPSYSTKREQALDSMIQISQANPAIWQIAPDLMVREMDWPGSEKLAERFERTLPANLIEDSENPIPPQITAQMQQMQQVIQQLQAGLQQAEQQLADKQADIAVKQADLQLKAQQMQLDADDAQRQAILDMEKIKLDKQKLEVEVLKAELGNVQNSMPDKTNNAQGPTIEHEPDDENVLLAKVQSLREKRQQDAVNQQMMQDLAIQEQASRAQQAEIDAQNSASEAALAQASLEKLDAIQTGLFMLTQAITAPKVVQRDPVTGLATGVVTVDTVGSA